MRATRAGSTARDGAAACRSPGRTSSRPRRSSRCSGCRSKWSRRGEPNGTYHWETEQEDFLVLSGQGLLIVEGQERPLKQWDFVHLPPETRHAFVGAGDGPCVLLCASSRQFQKDGPWGFYCADEVAARYNASAPEDTQDARLAYARFPTPQATRYRDGLLPKEPFDLI